jgi:hypothetical protein
MTIEQLLSEAGEAAATDALFEIHDQDVLGLLEDLQAHLAAAELLRYHLGADSKTEISDLVAKVPEALRQARQQGRHEMLLAALAAIGQAPSGPTNAAVTAEIQSAHRALEKL